MTLVALKKVHSWLSGFQVPDIEKQTLIAYAERATGDDRVLLDALVERFDDRYSGWPCVSIGQVMHECERRAGDILCKELPFTDIERDIVGCLYFEPVSLDNLVWMVEPWVDTTQEVVRGLIETGYVYDDGKLHLMKEKFPC